MSNNTRPQMSGQQQPPSPEQIQALGKLAELLKGMKPEYTPITKSLESIGIEPNVMTVMIGETPTECIVIPVQELMHKEWLRMINRNLTTLAQQQDERQADDA